jgi:hypothetical protein
MATKISTHPKMLDEILSQANALSDPVASIISNLDVSYVRGYLELAVSDDWITLDIDTVQFKQYDYHRSMAGATLLNRQTWNIVSNIFMAKEVPNRTKAVQYRALSEMLYSEESKILTQILDKNLTLLYPNLTFVVINEALFGKPVDESPNETV